jgi:hypothetical protein
MSHANQNMWVEVAGWGRVAQALIFVVNSAAKMGGENAF